MGVIDTPQWLLPAYIRSVKALGATAPQDDVRAAGERLIEEWSTPDRRFHNLKHVIDMLARVDELADETHNPDVMRVAAWYHGYVFSSTREETYKRNGGEDEVASAAYAARDLQELGLPPATVDRVCALILNLKRHNLPANDIDAMALNDADLGTLAVEPQLYKKYRIAVREEYRHVPIQDYLEARLEIVSRLLSRDRLFSSPLGARWEEAARENLAGERRMLAAKLEALRSGASIEEASKVATRVWNQVPGTTEVASPVSTTPSTSYAPATTFSAFSPVSPVSAASATTLSGGIPVVPPPQPSRRPRDAAPRPGGRTTGSSTTTTPPPWSPARQTSTGCWAGGAPPPRPLPPRRRRRARTAAPWPRRHGPAWPSRSRSADSGPGWSARRGPGRCPPLPRLSSRTAPAACRAGSLSTQARTSDKFSTGPEGAGTPRSAPCLPWLKPPTTAVPASGASAPRTERLPPMPVFAVDTQAVTDTATRTRTRISTIQTEVDAMNADIATLQASWTGGASASMASCAANWHLTQIQVQSSLDAISQALDKAALSYDDAETSNTSRFGLA